MERHGDLECVGDAADSGDLAQQVIDTTPDVVYIDYASPHFDVKDIEQILSILPGVHVLGVTDGVGKTLLEKALRSGLSGHLLKECDEDEFVDSARSVVRGEKFYCGKILDILRHDGDSEVATCDPIKLSTRELEIIRLIAEGYTNKGIADKLYLSAHTVMTHRKNIMGKLGVNNTAGIVIYAVRENIISPNKFLFASN